MGSVNLKDRRLRIVGETALSKTGQAALVIWTSSLTEKKPGECTFNMIKTWGMRQRKNNSYQSELFLLFENTLQKRDQRNAEEVNSKKREGKKLQRPRWDKTQHGK